MGTDGWTGVELEQYRDLLTKATTKDLGIMIDGIDSEIQFRCTKYKMLLSGQKIEV